ncbi:MAG: hypothetical protein IKG67_09230 [Parasporobacterium sp.]|nr:hypothetical protein [Parasporobacterium sp.]
MEILIAAAVCAWITFFAVWAYLKVKKDYRNDSSSVSVTKKGKDTVR